MKIQLRRLLRPGNQNYAIPADVNLTDVKSVAIYCERFHVNFGAAILK